MTQRHGSEHSSSVIPCVRRHGPDHGTVTLTATKHESAFRLGHIAQVPASTPCKECPVGDHVEYRRVRAHALRPPAQPRQAGARGPTLGRILAGAATMLLVAGCGGSSTPKLTSEESYRVADGRASINQVVLDGSEPDRAVAAVGYMVKLCKTKPDATYQAGKPEGDMTVSEVAADEAETLKGYHDAWALRLRDHC